MRRMLEELFYGNIDPNGKHIIRSTQYDEATRTVTETEEKLLKLLDGTEKSLFIENAGAQSEIIAIMALENFIGGFRLGARMAAEVFGGGDGCLKDIASRILWHIRRSPLCKIGGLHRPSHSERWSFMYAK